MKRIALTLVLLWPLVGAPLPAFALSPELMAAFRQYQTLNAQGSMLFMPEEVRVK